MVKLGSSGPVASSARLEAGDGRGARVALAEARALHPGNVVYRLRALWLALRGRE